MKRLLAAVLMVGASMAFGQDAPTESAARAALAKGEYAKVLEVYQPLNKAGSPLSDVAHYRLAIAASRLGMSKLAWQHLTDALNQNPQGSFATSPAKLADLRTSILEACAGDGRPQCVDAGPAPAPIAAPAGAVPQSAPVGPAALGATTPAAPAPPAPAVSSPAPTAQPTAAHPVDHAPPTVPSLARGEATQIAQPSAMWLSVALGTVLGILATVIGWQVRRYRRRRAAGTDVLEALRDAVAQLLHRLPLTGAEDTMLYRRLQQLLPLLEHEVGRTAYRATGTTGQLAEKDRKAVEWARHLSREPLDVLTASAHEIQSLFQRRAV